MDIYHIWCDLNPGTSDLEFAEATKTYLEHLIEEGQLESYRITRRKLGLSEKHLGEFHIILDFKDLASLDKAFSHVASRKDPVETFHHAVNSKVKNLQFALYRDFPDAIRVIGEERF